MGESKKISKEEVIAKLKDDGDFDKLRLKIIRKLKDNEELRNNIIAAVKQSAAINRPGAENMKLRQLSDAIHDEVGGKVMGQISDSLWEIIRSGDVRSEITETVQSVYNNLANPQGKEKGESSIHEMVPVGKESENNGITKATAGRIDETLSDSEPKAPPGFSLSNNHHSNHHQQQHKAKQQLPRPYEYDGAVENCREESSRSQEGQEEDDVDVGLPPGFSEDIDQKQPCDASDEDPDVPPGFG